MVTHLVLDIAEMEGVDWSSLARHGDKAKISALGPMAIPPLHYDHHPALDRGFGFPFKILIEKMRHPAQKPTSPSTHPSVLAALAPRHLLAGP